MSVPEETGVENVPRLYTPSIRRAVARVREIVEAFNGRVVSVHVVAPAIGPRRASMEFGGERSEHEAGDNVGDELLDLVRRGDRAGFDALAACVMPARDVAPCWNGARSRLGLDP